ncbi:MAG: FecR family protein [Sulfurovum sp.]|nr:FecR family protein [Sulfurovum sp.]
MLQKIFLFLLLTITTFAASIGTIMVAKGDGHIKRLHKTLPIASGMDIYKGDEIITKKKTRIQVMLNDDTVVTIGPDSSFSFVDYFFDGSKKSTIKMQANRGFFRSVTGKIGKIAPERFKVKTKLATIGIRGTDFSAQIGSNSSSYICNRGEITLKFSNIQKSVIAGEKMLLHLDSSGVKEMSASAVKNDAKASKVRKKHIKQINLDVNDLTNINTTNTIKTIKFNCD